MSVLTKLREKFPVLVPPKVKAEARVAIAKDVIVNLDIGRMKARKGTYYQLGKVYEGVDDTFESMSLAVRQPRGKATCWACAIGAACVSAVGLYDRAPEMEDDWEDCSGMVNDDTMRDVLARYFSRDQIGLIECAFEQSAGFAKIKDSPRVNRAEQFGVLVRSDILARQGVPRYRWKMVNAEADKVALRAIMTNIVENEGTFKP